MDQQKCREGAGDELGGWRQDCRPDLSDHFSVLKWSESWRVRAWALSYAECGLGLCLGCVCTCLGCAVGWRWWGVPTPDRVHTGEMLGTWGWA